MEQHNMDATNELALNEKKGKKKRG
jgi:hypothetical protein